jgi:hypothetical protein
MFANFVSAAASFLGMNGSNKTLFERVAHHPSDTCVLCFKSGIKRNASGCCDDCDVFAELLISDEVFAADVRLLIEQSIGTYSPKTPKNITIQFPSSTGIIHSLFVPDTSIFSNPEKHLFYGCVICSFFRTRHAYLISETKDFNISTDYAKHLLKETNSVEDMKQFSYCWMTCVQASLQVKDAVGVIPDFWLLEDRIEGQFHHFAAAYPIERRLTISPITYRDSDDDIVGIFRLETDIIIPEEEVGLAFLHGLPVYEMEGDCSTGRGGRVKQILHKSFAQPQLFIDHLWNAKHGQKLAKQERKSRDPKEQERKSREQKEQERKEKKQRQREEQRELDRKRHEEEKALKLARASLVEAVAQVDTQLETIRKLRELNREVALKNQKIADRKEAEKLAKEAEKRHAEKLKQKELERQKFISKKQ